MNIRPVSAFAATTLLCSVALAQTPAPTNAVPEEAPKTISIQEMLVIGHSGLKLHSLAMITQGNVKGGVDESFLPGFKVCAEDPATPVRSVAARLIGEHFVTGKENPNPEALALLVKLAQDESTDVQYSAVYHGLTQIKQMSDENIELLVNIAATNREPGLFDQIAQSLAPYRPKVQAILDRQLKEGKSIAYYEIYETLTGKKAPDNETYLDMPSSRPRMFIFKGEGRDPEAFKAALAADLKTAGLSNPDLAVSGVGENYVLLLKTFITRDSQTVEKRFADHPKFKITQDLWLTPELEIQIDAMRKTQ